MKQPKLVRPVRPVKYKLKSTHGAYTPYGLRNVSRTELKKEYTRLRNIANKRIARVESSEFAFPTELARYKDRFQTSFKDLTDSQLRQRLSELQRFLDSKRSTVTGLRESVTKSIQTLNDFGLTNINEKNLDLFGQFMETVRERNADKIFGSDAAAEFFNENNDRGLSVSDLAKSFARYAEKMAGKENEWVRIE